MFPDLRVLLGAAAVTLALVFGIIALLSFRISGGAGLDAGASGRADARASLPQPAGAPPGREWASWAEARRNEEAARVMSMRSDPSRDPWRQPQWPPVATTQPGPPQQTAPLAAAPDPAMPEPEILPAAAAPRELTATAPTSVALAATSMVATGTATTFAAAPALARPVTGPPAVPLDAVAAAPGPAPAVPHVDKAPRHQSEWREERVAAAAAPAPPGTPAMPAAVAEMPARGVLRGIGPPPPATDIATAGGEVVPYAPPQQAGESVGFTVLAIAMPRPQPLGPQPLGTRPVAREPLAAMARSAGVPWPPASRRPAAASGPAPLRTASLPQPLRDTQPIDETAAWSPSPAAPYSPPEQEGQVITGAIPDPAIDPVPAAGKGEGLVQSLPASGISLPETAPWPRDPRRLAATRFPSVPAAAPAQAAAPRQPAAGTGRAAPARQLRRQPAARRAAPAGQLRRPQTQQAQPANPYPLPFFYPENYRGPTYRAPAYTPPRFTPPQTPRP